LNGTTPYADPARCKGSGVCGDPIPNTYDVGLYCIGGGDCVYGQLYAETGPLDIPHFFRSCDLYGPPCYSVPGQKRYQVNLPFKDGPTTLPSGNYAVGMATNCDDGTGGGSGGGNGKCGLGLGEGGGTGENGTTNGTVKSGTQLLVFKYATQIPNTRCLLYDANHDNLLGLPPTLTSYDAGGCTGVNKGKVEPRLAVQAPHILNYAIW